MRNFRIFSLAIAASLCLISQARASNLISNGDFASGGTDWKFFSDTTKGDTATVDYSSSAAVITVKTWNSATNYRIQFSQKGIQLDSGSTYTVSFKASSTVARSLAIAFSTDSTWNYRGGGNASLTTSTQTFTVTIPVDSTTSAGVLQFNLGGTVATITIDSVVVAKKVAATAGANVLSNSDFSSGSSDWSFYVEPGKGDTATADFSSGAAVIDVSKWTSAANSNIQLSQNGIALVAGTAYTVSFDASSTVARTLAVDFSTTGTWHYQGGKSVGLTTSTKTFSVDITPDSSTTAGVLQFCLGGTVAKITIDNVSVVANATESSVLISDTVTVPDAPSSLPGYRVAGRHLFSPCGDTTVLRGINEMFIWGDPTGTSLPEIAKTGANAVRIVWLDSSGTPSALEALIKKAHANGLIPIVDFADATGNWDGLPKLVQGWLSSSYLKILTNETYQRYLIVNIGNEVGGSGVSAEDYAKGYDSSIALLRRAGVKVPLLIDAPTWGQQYGIFSSTAHTIEYNDSLHNTLFSVHMWWPIKNYGGTKAAVVTKIKSAISDAVSRNIPLVIGEFGEAFTDAGTVAATDSIPFRTILEQAQINRIGWLAWSWGKVNNNPQSDLNMTTDGTFSGLQTWGLEVATTDANSIKNTSKRPTDTVGCVDAIRSTSSHADGFLLQARKGSVLLQAPAAGTVEWVSPAGKVLGNASIKAGENNLVVPADRSGLVILREKISGRSWKILAP
jgi:hypothetical protein